MKQINKVAVIGSGVMGAGIAAHMANAGLPVILMDRVPEGEKKRNILSESAIEKMLKADPSPLTLQSKANLITPANIEDNLEMLSDVDWIVEVVLEQIDVKRELFKKIEPYRKKGSIISSNTSTLPLASMAQGMPESFQKDFLITHFFNPPRYMRLLELVVGEHTRADAVDIIREFADIRLGKGVVDCHDRPGFIANRIGCYWLTVGLLQAIELGITVEEADAVMSRPVGIPKTGVFGLMDLIGIDLLPLIAKSFQENLSESDAFCQTYEEPKLVTRLIEEGYTGRKGKGGFYRLNKKDGKKIKEAINLQDGSYRTADKNIALESVKTAKAGLRQLVEHPDIGGQYAKAVLVPLLEYTASLVPEICDDIASVDEAMRLGYNWKYGPFELIDRLSTEEMSGAQWLSQEIKANGRNVPELLQQVGEGRFYQEQQEQRQFFTTKGEYQDFVESDSVFMLADKKRGKKPIKRNGSASIWDIGDGIACLEYHSKMNSVDLDTLSMLKDAVEIVQSDFKGLVIGNDADNFCVGANIGMALFLANIGAWKMVETMIDSGQQAYMGLKYAPFPVVTATSGMALGGGCEILLHSDAVQAHIETYTGLVEVGVGVLPGWGGCKEMILRQFKKRYKQGGIAAIGRAFDWLKPVAWANTMPSIRAAFMQIALAKVAKSAEEAREMLILNEKSRITMNRKRLLPDAKALCLELAEDYQPPEQEKLKLPGKSARAALYMGISEFVKKGKATPHDAVVSKAIANVLSGGQEADMNKQLDEQYMLDLEKKFFMQLVKTEGTWDRLEHMLETGKPLRN